VTGGIVIDGSGPSGGVVIGGVLMIGGDLPGLDAGGC
jgi:hypothetical protein